MTTARPANAAPPALENGALSVLAQLKRQADAASSALNVLFTSNELEPSLRQTIAQEASACITDLMDAYRHLVENEAALMRTIQVVDVIRNIDDMGTALLSGLMFSGEPVEMVIPATSPVDLEGAVVGALARVDRGHGRLLSVSAEVPWYCSVGTISHIDENGPRGIAYDLKTAQGGNEQALLPAHGCDISALDVGTQVYFCGRFVYRSRGAVRSEFVSKRTTNSTYDSYSRDQLVGDQPNKALTDILTVADTVLNPHKFVVRDRTRDGRLLMVGPTGRGKSFTISVAIAEIRRMAGNPSRVRVITLAGNELRSKWVGEGSERVMDLVRSAVEDGDGEVDLTIIVIEECTTLLRDRGAGAGDSSGVTLEMSETFLAGLESAVADTAGANTIWLLTTNRADLADSAALGRFEKLRLDEFDPGDYLGVMGVDRRRNPSLYAGDWERDFVPAIRQALEVPIGRVLVGKEWREDLRVRHVITGRQAAFATARAGKVVDKYCHLFGGLDASPVKKITPAMLATLAVHSAWDDLKPMPLHEVRTHLASTELCRDGREDRIQGFEALRSELLCIPDELDARPLLAEISQLQSARR